VMKEGLRTAGQTIETIHYGNAEQNLLMLEDCQLGPKPWDWLGHNWARKHYSVKTSEY